MFGDVDLRGILARRAAKKATSVHHLVKRRARFDGWEHPRLCALEYVPAVDFYIRTTREDDWPLVRDLRIENATDNPISWTATREETLLIDEDGWRLRARRGQMSATTSVVAIETGTHRWLGMMNGQIGDEYGTDPVLTGVYVTPDARGRRHGVADALLAAVVEWATVRAETLRLHVYEHAEPARRFYARNGFVLTGRTQPVHVRGSQPQPTAGLVLELRRVLPRPGKSGGSA